MVEPEECVCPKVAAASCPAMRWVGQGRLPATWGCLEGWGWMSRPPPSCAGPRGAGACGWLVQDQVPGEDFGLAEEDGGSTRLLLPRLDWGSAETAREDVGPLPGWVPALGARGSTAPILGFLEPWGPCCREAVALNSPFTWALCS